jgi:hypothetical protein
MPQEPFEIQKIALPKDDSTNNEAPHNPREKVSNCTAFFSGSILIIPS